jgi:predicted YcjX-like family ATPase
MIAPLSIRRMASYVWEKTRGQMAGGLIQSIGDMAEALTNPFGDNTLRLGVTGLSRAGKTVFITSLVNNLLERGRMPQLRAQAEGRIDAVFLQPQPDLTLPRFDYETHLAALTGDNPHWPDSTRAVSELRLSFRVQPGGWFAGWRGPAELHLDIVDYPGEWLLDLGLLDQSYAEWSEEVLTRLAKRAEGADFLATARAEDGALPHAEDRAKLLADRFTSYLTTARAAGRSDCTPGRFLLPGDLAGSPVLTFAPLPMPGQTPRGCLWREMQRRYDAYVSRVVRPFFQTHFARIDRQIVLVDVLEAVHRGPQALEDLRRTMADVLDAFRPGRNGFLDRLWNGKRVEKILFAATKADHLHHSQHPRLQSLLRAMVQDAEQRAAFRGARVEALALSALRTTVEETVTRDGQTLDMVRGRLLSDGRQVAMFAGDLPEDPARLMASARQGADQWLDAEYALMHFAPARISRKPGEGLPHIRIDRAAEFLLGDRL